MGILGNTEYCTYDMYTLYMSCQVAYNRPLDFERARKGPVVEIAGENVAPSAPYDVAVNTYLFACWLFHTITFEQSIFRENAIFKMFSGLRRSRRYLRLDTQLRVVAGLVVPDRHTRQTV